MSQETTTYFSESDAELTRKIGILDAHNDFVLAIVKQRWDGVYDSLRSYWLPRFRAGGVTIAVCPIFIPDNYLPDSALRFAIQAIDALYLEIEDNQDQIELALNYADIERITAEGKIAAVLAFEGAEPLGQDLSALRHFYRLGLRILSFTWMRRTAFADGTWENDSRGGLTRLGRRAVQEMNRLGIVVDVSHASDQTTWDILDESTQPVVATHSNARKVHDHLRNLTDDMIKSIASAGGVVGAVAVSRFVTDGTPTIGKWVDHIDHMVEIAGMEHVGIGADFYRYVADINAVQMIDEWALKDNVSLTQNPFVGMLGPEDFPGLTAELLKRGYSEDDLTKLYHGNFMRVLQQVLR